MWADKSDFILHWSTEKNVNDIFVMGVNEEVTGDINELKTKAYRTDRK